MKKTCLHCKSAFNALAHRRKYCGLKCYRASTNTDANGYARFWVQVRKTPSCWFWTGWVTSAGYGETCVRRKRILAHRLSYQLAYGSIPHGKLIMHLCDQPLCVRPDHLRPGTDAENQADMRAKGRHAKGEELRHRLTEIQVLEIRKAFRRNGRWSNALDLARRYGVTRNTIIGAATGTSWSHLK